MCNAWNHSPGCTCGFGGVGHIGRRGSGSSTPRTFSSAYWGVPPITHTYESYVNPNARCPECHASVFFYQSPEGGRVFFDELGPPWPKHPCTDNSSIPKNIRNITTPNKQGDSARTYAWQVDGWDPYFIFLTERVDRSVLKIKGRFKEREVTLYILKRINPHGDTYQITSKSIAHLRNSGEGMYDLSFVTEFARNNTITINAFSSLPQTRKNRNTTKAKESRAVQNNAAMALAFAKAQKNRNYKI